MSPARPVAVPVTFLVGAATAVATVALHDHAWGLLLAVVATGTTLVALPPGWWARVPYAAGWVVTVGCLTVPRGEGDYLLSRDPAGYAVLLTALVVALVAFLTVPRGGGEAGGSRPAP